MLTTNNQSRHVFPVAHGVIVRCDFQDVESVRPVEAVRLAGVIFFVENNQVWREVGFVENSTLKLFQAVDVIHLRDSGTDLLNLD